MEINWSQIDFMEYRSFDFPLLFFQKSQFVVGAADNTAGKMPSHLLKRD